MRRFIIIQNNIVVDLVDKDGDFASEDTTVEFDTVVDDYTNTYIIGDTYTLEDYLVRNNLSTTADSSVPSDKIASLWTKAFNYERAQISGSALSMLSILLLQGNTKALAVQSWIRSIWDIYYQEKALIEADSIYISEEDFIGCGDMPYTVPELTADYDAWLAVQPVA